ncbi:hypothetical protein CALCODRAFT_518624 [Calocera cornea HHB12733]|uniref:Glycosyltransferase family 1 protein n=1 Tax=Calocera cornea HHB12733 TaxID=1353952 RepID=A0A165EVT4_9BASI|nr:hypothetical protein CALCODRAFT_518624 [Calocera cornea HHB12733]
MQPGSLAAKQKQRTYLVLCIFVTVVCVLWLFRNQVVLGTSELHWLASSEGELVGPEQAALGHLRVAVVEQEEFHMEVLGAVINDLQRLGIKPRVYRSSPYLYRFGEVLHRFFPDGYEKIVQDKDTGVFQPGPLEDAIRAGEYDIVVLNSCHWALWWETHIFMALNESNAHVVCLVHTPNEGGVGQAKQQWAEIGAQGRLTALTLSPHTRRAAADLFDTWAAEEHDVSWDRIPVDYFVPLFPALEDPHAVRKSRVPSKFVIQGSIDTLRRDYDGLISELLEMIKADPHSWGYQRAAEGNPFTPLAKPAHGSVPTPFTLHLIGHSIREPKIPEEMKNVVLIRDSPDFSEFYGELSEMDVLIPAFSADSYLTSVASSSIPAALMTRTPVLASPAHLRSYAYLAPPAVVVRPSSMTDAEAIARLRAGRDLLDGVAISGNRFNYTTYSGWDEYEDSILRDNAATWRRILARVESKPH